MSLLIGSAITIVGVEIAMFVMSSIRQSRTIDHSIVAYYAAETGAEHIMHQVRKEGLTTFDDLRKKTDTFDEATWSVQEYHEPDTIVGVFRDSISELQRSTLRASDAVQASLYRNTQQNGYRAVQGLKSMKVLWSSESCPSQRPTFEMTALEFTDGGTILWDDPNTQLKKDIQSAPEQDAGVKQIFFNFTDEQGNPINKPMIVRVKVFYCDVAGLKLTLYTDLDGTGNQLDIPNYFYINPKGVYKGVSRDELKSTFADQDAASSVFDFVLFSQDQITK